MGTHLEAVKSLGQQTFSFLCFYVRPPSFQEQSWSHISSVTLQPLRNNNHLLHDPTFPPSPSSPWEITFSSPPWYQTSPLHPQPHMSSLYAASLILHTVFPPPNPSSNHTQEEPLRPKGFRHWHVLFLVQAVVQGQKGWDFLVQWILHRILLKRRKRSQRWVM